MSLLDRAARFIDDVLLLPDDAREAIERAEAALDRGAHAEAEALLREVLSSRPSLLRARQGLALALAGRGELEEARRILTVSRQLDPDEPEVALLSASLALRAGDIEAAVEEARDAARRLARDGGGRFAEACAIRARAERARGRMDRAARELRKAVAAAPELQALRVELAEVLAASGRGGQAAAIAKRLELSSLDPAAATRLGEALRQVGEHERARPLLERGGEAGHSDALAGRARLALASGDFAEAETFARTAVARGGGADALVVLAEVLRAQQRAHEAAEVLLTASEARGGDAALLRRAGRLVSLSDAGGLSRIADRLEELAPGDDTARTVRAWARLVAGDVESAAELASEPLTEPRLALAAAEVALARRRPQEALAALTEVAAGLEACDADRVSQLRRDALRELWRGPTGQVDLAAAIDEVARFAEQRDLSDAHRRALALRDELDRPLLLAVLGEFNAGKSTLVNAFLGADVAPTGIFPTTATLNVLRSGAERRVRVVREDGTTREGEYAELRPLLEEAGGSESGIDHVEITLPSETLERVWVLDTPGSNAPVPEHEALAAEALRRADAALWVFDSGQAGKATEGKILRAIRDSRRHVVAALNKVDRLSPAQLAEIRAALARDLPEVGEDAVALSAKGALKARLADDDEAWHESGFPTLLERLERDVFSRSRELKRRACGGRLIALLDQTLASEGDAVAAFEVRIEALEAASRPLAVAVGRLDGLVDQALSAFEQDQEDAFLAAAREVLAFVRPRTHRFAKHGADLEDRAFLAEVIERQLDQALKACEARLVAQARGLFADARERLTLSGDALDRRVREAVVPSIARFAGYQSGLLRGGALRRFFEEELPSAELAEAPISASLSVARARPREHLRPTLRDGLYLLAHDLETQRVDSIGRERKERRALHDHVYEPIRVLRGVLEELVD